MLSAALMCEIQRVLSHNRIMSEISAESKTRMEVKNSTLWHRCLVESGVFDVFCEPHAASIQKIRSEVGSPQSGPP
jgi:hypothetical protein